jgi:hypothetical protein
LGAHDLGAHDLGAHDLGAHDLGAHDLGAHDLGAHDLGTHDLGRELDSERRAEDWSWVTGALHQAGGDTHERATVNE